MKVRPKRICEIECVQWTGSRESYEEIVRLGAKFDPFEEASLIAGVDGARGWVPVPVNHYIFKGSSNAFWPVDPDYFNENYEVVSSEDQEPAHNPQED
jgi:hypothetical protein